MGSDMIFIVSIAVAGIAMAIGSLMTASAQGNALAKAMEGISRQPEASGAINGTLIIGLAFIESIAIYVLVVALIILFANPFTAPYMKVETLRAENQVLSLEMEKKQLEAQMAKTVEAKPAEKAAKGK